MNGWTYIEDGLPGTDQSREIEVSMGIPGVNDDYTAYARFIAKECRWVYSPDGYSIAGVYAWRPRLPAPRRKEKEQNG